METQADPQVPTQVDADEAIVEPSVSRSSKRTHSRRQAKPKKSEESRRTNLLWEFRFEFLALILFGLGVFLLLEQFKIRVWLAQVAIAAFGSVKETVIWLVGATSVIEKSDIVGIVFVISAVLLIGFDIRSRVLRWHEGIEAEPLCSKCGKQMSRTRSSKFQQLLAHVFRVRIKRFFCTKCAHRMSVWRTPRESDW